MTTRTIALRAVVLAAAGLVLSGCIAMTVAGATVGVAGAAVGVAGKAVVMTAKGAGAVVGAAIPDGKDKKDDKSDS